MKEAVSAAQMDMTLDVMAHTLVYWTQAVVARGLMTEGGRIFAMTSSGGRRVLPAYGPVSAAKAALESHVRQLAMELAPRSITVNAIQAGVSSKDPPGTTAWSTGPGGAIRAAASPRPTTSPARSSCSPTPTPAG
jgi:NAD(P)-dependent dehydrogenase (short-subunit alcohol dehydrogenase family)